MSSVGLSNENSLWMGDVEPFMDEAYIRNAYKTMGENVVRVKFVKDKKSGGRAMFCFVIFADKSQASRVLQNLNGKPFPNHPAKKFKLNFAQYGKDFSSPEFHLYVGELTPDVTDQTLQHFFAERYLSVKGATVVTDNNGKSRGYGFVRFYNEYEQSQAQQQMNGAKGLGGKLLRVSKATPKIARQIDKAFQQGSVQTSTYSPSVNSNGKSFQMAMYNSDYKFPGFYSNWNNYNYCYYSQTGVSALNGAGDAAKQNDDDALEDPSLTVDIDRMNIEFMDQSEEFYMAVEDSRWFAIDNITTTYDDICK